MTSDKVKKAFRKAVSTLPPAPKTFDATDRIIISQRDLSLLPDEDMVNEAMHCVKNQPLTHSKSGTLTGIQAFCPECSTEEELKTTTHIMFGRNGKYLIVLCTECGKKHELLFEVETMK